MKKLYYFLLVLGSGVFFMSCQSETEKYLAKRWDCVQVENLAPIDIKYASKEDSVAAFKAEAALKTLVWTFNKDHTYQCTASNIPTVQGTYQVSGGGKTLTLTPNSKNEIVYTITSISEIEMTLTSTGINLPLILHFRPN